MSRIIKVILLVNSEKLISEIEEVGADIGEPDCKLVKPMEIWEGHNLCPWHMNDTQDTEFMISSEKIITLMEPIATLKEKYINLTK